MTSHAFLGRIAPTRIWLRAQDLMLRPGHMFHRSMTGLITAVFDGSIEARPIGVPRAPNTAPLLSSHRTTMGGRKAQPSSFGLYELSRQTPGKSILSVGQNANGQRAIASPLVLFLRLRNAFGEGVYVRMGGRMDKLVRRSDRPARSAELGSKMHAGNPLGVARSVQRWVYEACPMVPCPMAQSWLR